MKIFLLFLFILVPTTIFAENSIKALDAYEEATIHFHDGTSIRGYAKITFNSSVKFKVTEDREPEAWTELMIKGVTFHRAIDDIDFLYVKLEKVKTPLLLEVIELGEISIFVDVSSNWISANHSTNETGMLHTVTSIQNTTYSFFLKKESEKEAIRLFGIFNFKKKAIKFFENCPQIVDRLNEKKYKRGNIIEMVYYYNDYCAALD
ncbi:hypothetical protein [Psychroserpens damuponensis]|uniref:hypothetical protein n=1 Tax=Psychroserpens damuponensis TaxID=943936 RepID=UPI00058FE188|nr:hypothetical protein [Psychroserpens damuponensis]